MNRQEAVDIIKRIAKDAINAGLIPVLDIE